MSFERDATLLLKSACAGNPDAPSKLLPLVYDELRRVARAYLIRERRNHTLQATELVHEAYLRLRDPAQLRVDPLHQPGKGLAFSPAPFEQEISDALRRAGAIIRAVTIKVLMMKDLIVIDGRFFVR